MAVAMAMVGCATGPGEFSQSTAVVGASGAVGVESHGNSLSMSDQSLLRKSRKVYENALGDAGWKEDTEYSGRLKVYRWGANATAPIERYAWDPDAGERWHVVRETCGGSRESCGRGATPPIDEFYAIEDDAVKVTIVEPSEPVEEANPQPALPQYDLAISFH